MGAIDGPLPELNGERLTAVEDGIFTRIGAERERRRRRRRLLWAGGAAAAVVIVVAAAVSPAVISALRPATAASAPFDPIVEGTTEALIPPASGQLPHAATEGAQGDARVADRAVVATATASVTVDSVREAVRSISDDAVSRGGYVESVTLSADGADSADSPTSGAAREPAIYPPIALRDSVTVRVPSESLTDVVASLATVGEVTASTVNRQDVTTAQTDLRARIAAQEASVARLTQLIATATSTSDLIAAESALSERQAALDSDRQQLVRLESDIALSSLTVQLTPRTTAVTADPASFVDGLAAGWNGFVAALNGLTVGLGFLLPWIVIAAIVVLIVWGVRVIRARARSRRTPRQ